VVDFIFGKQQKIGNKKAYSMENLRHKYQQETNNLFSQMQLQNQLINSLPSLTSHQLTKAILAKL